MVFFTVFFLIVSLISLVKGSLFRNIYVTFGEEAIKAYKLGKDYKPDGKLGLKLFLSSVFALFISLSQFIYYCIAINYDNFKYPTLCFMVYFILVLVWSIAKRRSKLDLSTDEKIHKYRAKLYRGQTFKSTIAQLANVAYFAYMMWQIVFN